MDCSSVDLKGQRVAIALSGGVDSAVAAALLKEQGADLFALTLRLLEDSSTEDACRVADHLGIPLAVIDGRARFRSCVMDSFVRSYEQGETPNPCILCNRMIKFGDLLDAAREKGATFLATGHYARRVDGPDGVELHRGRDLHRDQSYFLYRLSREQLEQALFPLGGRTKSEVRGLAAGLGLPVAQKPDSQDICFVPGGDYVRVLEMLRPGVQKPGHIVDQAGNVLGRHEGIVHYTVGQRKGLALSHRCGEKNEPLYVLRLDAGPNQVIVGPRTALEKREVLLADMHWLAGEMPQQEVMGEARLRSTQPLAPARLIVGEAGRANLIFREPVWGVSPGQAAVLYQGDRVMGGGRIIG